jgi:DNA-binding response OmpR family regulator
VERTGRTILLINAEATLCRSLALLLRQAGYRVTTAENEEEALEFLTGGHFDLVCLDLKGDERNGARLEAIRELCQQYEGIPVLFLADSAHEQAVLRNLDDVNYESLVKPLDPPHFLESVHSMLAA